MKKIRSFLAVAFLLAADVCAQPPAPTIKIRCTVSYEYVRRYVAENTTMPRIATQGDYFSSQGFFITRREVDLYPIKIGRAGRYKVTLDAATSSFLSHVCAEDIRQVLSYIDTHEFETMQNVFFAGENGGPSPATASKRRVGDWNLISWNNENTFRE